MCCALEGPACGRALHGACSCCVEMVGRIMSHCGAWSGAIFVLLSGVRVADGGSAFVSPLQTRSWTQWRGMSGVVGVRQSNWPCFSTEAGKEGGGDKGLLEQVKRLDIEGAGGLKLVDLREAVRAAGLRPGARSKAELVALLDSQGLLQKAGGSSPEGNVVGVAAGAQRQQGAARPVAPTAMGAAVGEPASVPRRDEAQSAPPYGRPPLRRRGPPSDSDAPSPMAAMTGENAYLRKKRNKAEAAAAKLAKSRRRSMPRLDELVGDKLREQYGLPVGGDALDPEVETSELSPADREALHVPEGPTMADETADGNTDDAQMSGQGSCLSDEDNRLPAFTTGNSTGCDVEVCFLGTASCVPSVTRSVSCIALRQQGNTWLFDVGEGSQVQVQRSQIKPSRISKIFVTHAHGDHTFGLPGIMCLMGMEREQFEDVPVDIYGPEGLRMYLRTTIRFTLSRIVPRYRVHEIKNIPMLHKRGKWATSYTLDMDESALAMDPRFGEVEGGQDIYPDSQGLWTLVNDDNMVVQAGPMVHTVPCVGFVVTERPKPGRLRAEHVAPIVARNRDALKAQGVADPNKIFRLLKSLRPGEEVAMPDGTVLKAEDVMEGAKPGRKVVVCGDTCDASSLAEISQNADMLIHESTNAFLPPFDKGTYMDVERFAVAHGHSTPQMAGAFARRIKARTLVLTHFSPRYKGDQSPESKNIMRKLEDMARKASGMAGERVIAAHDLMLVPVPARKQAGTQAAEGAGTQKEERRGRRRNAAE